MRERQCVPILLALVLAVPLAAEDDPFLWLEEINGTKALAWVKQHNERATKELQAVPEYKAILEQAQEIYDSPARIPTPELRGERIYNLWQDASHPRGLWRRTSLDSFRTPEPSWEPVLDLDALGKAEGKSWLLQGAVCLPPQHQRCMLALSDGGSDASELREFDTTTKTFVAGGFTLPVAKSSVSWKDQDTLWIATDFGAGTLTSSGYPRLAKEWKRGTPLASARTILECKVDDVGVWPAIQHNAEGRYDLLAAGRTTFTTDLFLGLGGRSVHLDVPATADLEGFFADRILLELNSDWSVGKTVFPEGSLLALPLDGLLQGDPRPEVLFEPGERLALDSVAITKDRVVTVVLDNVHAKVIRLAHGAGGWTREELPLPGDGSIQVAAADPLSEAFFLSFEDFLTPESLILISGSKAEKLKALPAQFDVDGMQVRQFQATSKDGTKVPYFLVTPKGFALGNEVPTLLYGYGGFKVSELPRYNAITGSAWLARGGVFALANIRGGGELGPRWHKAAMKDKRIKSFEDFMAVAADLVARNVTTRKHLGIMGGSQGGLLVGGSFVLQPELFSAVVCQVPLLDMRRYNQLLAGASWLEEYGNPDTPEDWATMKVWSPYQNVRADVPYPKIFIWTNTRDDRVHPGHARKMVARLEALHHPVLYFENTEGGHASGAVNKQRAQIRAMEYAYLWEMLR
jgi:prolyl oligopeptidase